MLKNRIKEGIDEFGAPDEKYYAFDWDDNIVSMPTKILLKDEDGDVVGMSTENFAKYREIIGKEPFEFDGHTIVGYSEDAYKYFGIKGDKQFIIDAMSAKPAAAWPDFVEAVNNGSIFSIVTARGHTPSVLKEGVYNYIVSNMNGIDSNELVRNLEKYRDLNDEGTTSKREMIREYLDLCKFYPVTYGKGSAAEVESLKIEALNEFVTYVKEMSNHIQKKAFLKNKISNYFVPRIGFSDDDLKNVESVKKHFEDDPENIITTYSTAGGIKTKY
jgi:hypothetical protein